MPECIVCGHIDRPGRKRRSTEQHRRYFSLIKRAFDNWPEHHPHQFSSSEELRAFLQMKAGAREIGAQIPLAGITKERAMLLVEASIRGAGSYAVPVMHGDTLVIFRPKSIAFAKMAHSDFCALSSGVEALIVDAIGVSADQLLERQEA